MLRVKVLVSEIVEVVVTVKGSRPGHQQGSRGPIGTDKLMIFILPPDVGRR
jgi:hypothetical protein